MALDLKVLGCLLGSVNSYHVCFFLLVKYLIRYNILCSWFVKAFQVYQFWMDCNVKNEVLLNKGYLLKWYWLGA
jgi:hypothetical protein